MDTSRQAEHWFLSGSYLAAQSVCAVAVGGTEYTPNLCLGLSNLSPGLFCPVHLLPVSTVEGKRQRSGQEEFHWTLSKGAAGSIESSSCSSFPGHLLSGVAKGREALDHQPEIQSWT